MRSINIPYESFKTAADVPIGAFAHIVRGSDKEVFVGHREAVFDAWATGADVTHWDANYDADSIAVANKDEAIAIVIGLTQLENPRRDSDGVRRVAIARHSTTRLLDPQWTGCGDNIAAGTINNQTNRLELQSTTSGNKNLNWQFTEPVELTGGLVSVKNGSFGDWIRYELTAPFDAAMVTSNPGAGAYAKVAIGGGVSMFKPLASSDWDLDLTTTLNANVLTTKVTPIPALNGKKKANGWFDWNRNSGVVTPNANRKGKYNLLDAATLIATTIAYAPANGTRDIPFLLLEDEPKLILPHWTHEARWHSSDTASKELSIGLELAREHTWGGPYV